MAEDIRLLNQYQTDEFDTEYVNSSLFRLVENHLDNENDAQGLLNLLDVGGGNGRYCDRFLRSYPDWLCTLVEPELSLLQKNIPHRNKTLLNYTYQTLTNNILYNAIQFNWVLHHFVSDSYFKSCKAQKEGVEKAKDLLEPGGSILIFENFYEGFGFVELPSSIIYQVTGSTLLQNFAASMGANTAGVGVCFHSEQYWVNLLRKTGFIDIKVKHCYDFGNLSLVKKILLGLEHQRVGFITAKKPGL